jgi:hypothetical protein
MLIKRAWFLSEAEGARSLQTFLRRPQCALDRKAFLHDKTAP